MNSFSRGNFPFNIILTTILLVGRFLKHFSKLASRALEALVLKRNSSLKYSSSKLMWKKNPHGTQVPHTSKTKPNKFFISVNLSLGPAFILLRNPKNHYLHSSPQLPSFHLRSSPQPLPLFFLKTLRIAAFDLLKNPSLRSSGCWC